MKLFYCTQCRDIKALRLSWRSCWCGATSGRYHADGNRYDLWGPGVAIGMDNFTLTSSLAATLDTGEGDYIKTWTLPTPAYIHKRNEKATKYVRAYLSLIAKEADLGFILKKEGGLRPYFLVRLGLWLMGLKPKD